MCNNCTEACQEGPLSNLTDSDFLRFAPCPPVWNKDLLWEIVVNCSLAANETDIIAERCNVQKRVTTQDGVPTFGTTGSVNNNGAATSTDATGSTSIDGGSTSTDFVPEPVLQGASMPGCGIACIFAIVGAVILLIIFAIVIFIMVQRRKEGKKRKPSQNHSRSSSYYRDSVLSTNSTQGLYPDIHNRRMMYQQRWEEAEPVPQQKIENPIYSDSPPFTRRRPLEEPQNFPKPSDSNGTTVLGLSVIQPGYVYVNPSLQDIETDEPRVDYDIPYIDEDRKHVYYAVSPQYVGERL